jgi:hypothetical protein
MALSDENIIVWFNENLGDHMSMYQSGENSENIIICEKLPCSVITSSRIVKGKNSHSGVEDEILMPLAAWSSDLIKWKDGMKKNDYEEHRCSMYEFKNLKAVIDYLQLLWLLKGEIPCLSYRKKADEQRLGFITDVDSIKSFSKDLNCLMKPFFNISH